jgi:hypothetical protein
MQLSKHGLRFSTPIQNIARLIFFFCLLAFLFSAIFAKPRPGCRITCLSNTKQQGLGLLLYAQDYDDYLPRASEWMDLSYPYIKNKLLYCCPDLSPDHFPRPDAFGYAFNNVFSSKSLDEIPNWKKTLLHYDSNDLRWNANVPGRTGLALPPRSPQGNSYGFADGHAKVIPMASGDE